VRRDDEFAMQFGPRETARGELTVPWGDDELVVLGAYRVAYTTRKNQSGHVVDLLLLPGGRSVPFHHCAGVTLPKRIRVNGNREAEDEQS
jgi:hypothetical protein